MRIGIVLTPGPLPGGSHAAIDQVVTIARRTEALGFDSLWVTDAFARGQATLEPYSLLGTLCAVTNRIELGTCVVQVPLRHPVEHAHRVQTINVLSGGRFRFGFGTGSTKHDFEAVQADYDTRFKRLPGMIADMHKVWAGEPLHGPALSIWPGTQGGPPIMLGAWRSERWINYAAKQCDGWISSGIFSGWDDVAVGQKMYRDAGGKRALIANLVADFRDDVPEATRRRKLSISLVCTPAEGRDRLKRLADLGLDDALIVAPFDDADQLEIIRGLV